MKSAFFSVLAASAAAFPQVVKQLSHRDTGSCTVSAACEARLDIPDSKIQYDSSNLTPAQRLSEDRNNCGGLYTCATFDAKAQHVSSTGQWQYQKPGPSDIRGPCPGLNVAANHGYLPRSGVASIAQTIDGMGAMFGMGVDLSGFLAAYAVVMDGDWITQTWSIGGPPPMTLLGSGLLSQPKGMSYAHNKYEGDSSITRCDAYINDGDAHSLSTERFKYVYEEGMANDRYNMEIMARAYAKNAFRSEMQNPYYFAPLFSTTLVAPAAYNFIVAFLSNHSAEEPSGYLDGDSFKKWFAIEGEYPNFKWLPGQEQMPDNWYRRPFTAVDAYDIPRGVFGDLAYHFLAYPNAVRFGGNTNGVNTYNSVNLSSMTGGTYDASTFTDSNAFGCLIYQNLQQAVPDQLQGLVADVSGAMKLLNGYMGKAFGALTCPQLEKFDQDALRAYPGGSYSPTGPANNC